MIGRRRTARERAVAVLLPGALVLAGPVVLSGVAVAAPVSASAASSSSFALAEDAQPIPAAAGTTDAVRLEPGRTYRSTLPAGGKAYYRLLLDATSNGYVSATAVPDPDTTVTAVEGIKVSVQDADGRSCSFDTTTFGAARSPHPIAAAAAREAGGNRCQGAGTYYVVVERAGTTDPAPAAWELELATVEEPGLTRAEATKAPEAWDSATPAPPTDEPEQRPGGAGFASATSVGQGVWTDDIAPGQTLFYKVPVDWGRQLSATAELGTATTGSGYASSALDVSLYNPVRAFVTDKGVGYDGKQRTAALAPLPPVDHANRHSFTDRVSGMRFAGSYYLVVHLSAEVAEEFGDGPFGLTLRVGVKGAAQEGPAYAGESVPEGVFHVRGGGLGGGLGAVAGGAGEAGGDGAMTAVAVGGIGAGSVILVGLGVWTAVARRRAGLVG
ncbi:hypothetical protein SSP24_58360 [Streptomyces spinoverrucosus]|uniref:Uncharacterized protein n=1 Tax=Streptomyces spinoverrucosus TaxID=284043 RepID=A0A4Y3VQZ8_9ACTN|nr:hypothetical protein [Streptomyces spinoverrucosus]GEC08181.1 hypothetical protein SSP24_58360 [Streptomyces spinoverrucosus]GHB62953.1 hypothetical protein GCM10010397_36270 [Streptomyces spinoverrucosus]